jgi:hypothetical protein
MALRNMLVATAIVAVAVVSCVQRKEATILRVDINPSSAGTCSIFDFFEKIDIIPLEDSCLISNGQFSEPQYWAVSDSGYFVLDERNNNVVSFDTSGHYRGVISRRGRAQNEYSLAYGIQINDISKTVKVQDPRGSFFRYDYSGRFVGKDKVKGLTAMHNFLETSTGTVLFSFSTDAHLYLWEDGSLSTIHYTPSVRINKGDYRAPFPFIHHESEAYIYEGMTGEIYEINRKTRQTELKYTWDFGQNNPDLSRISRPDYDFLESLKNEFYNEVFPFLHIIRFGETLVANVIYHNHENALFYDLETHKSVFINRFKEGVRFKAHKEKGGSLYFMTDVESLDEFASPLILDGHNRQIYESMQGRQKNPVIIIYRGFHKNSIACHI